MYKVMRFEFKEEEREKDNRKFTVWKRSYIMVSSNLSWEEAKIMRTVIKGQIVKM